MTDTPTNPEVPEDQDPSLASGGDPDVYEQGVLTVDLGDDDGQNG